jgi:hypothetical protein
MGGETKAPFPPLLICVTVPAMKTSLMVVGLAVCIAGGLGMGCKSSDGGAAGEKGASAGQGADPSGSYAITSSTNPGGAPGYTGSLKITRSGDIHDVTWTIPNTPSYTGVAVLSGSTLGVGWGVGARYGVAVYTVTSGHLSGRWATKGASGRAGTEVLDGPAGLSGTYKITSGSAPDGKSYTGTVAITPTGETFAVKWTLATDSYSGVGIKQGDTLVVGWGDAGKDAGVVSYQVSASALDGKWATPGGTKLGTEILGKR